jgi:hypothetical protein
MAINKVIKYGLEAEANALKTQGLSDAEIARELSGRSGEKISRHSVWRYFNKNNDAVVARISQREEIVEKAMNERIDTVKQLITINRTTLLILKEAKMAGDMRTALKAIERIEKQLELQAKLLGDIQEVPTTLVWNIVRAVRDAPDC